jgi:hydroxymethylpyrimidine pyrophosphatase-like HAD family hydrolase
MLWPLDNTVLLHMLDKQTSLRRALFTDIDDTLIDRAKRAHLIAAAWELRDWANTHHCPIILVSGVDFTGVLARIKVGGIPPAEAVIGAVGTELWLRQPDDSWVRDRQYDQLVRASGYSRHQVTTKAAILAAELNSHYPELRLQFQALPDHLTKVSLHFFAEDGDVWQIAQEFQREFPAYHIVTCREIHYNALLPADAAVVKHCLDIVPATKQTAITYLIDRLELTHGYKAGDSGNDIGMLLNPDPLLPILVGGYKAEALQAISQELTLHRPGVIQYLKDGRPIYIENGDRLAAQSILHATQLVKQAGKPASRPQGQPATGRPTERP